jgi:hypothetical protein
MSTGRFFELINRRYFFVISYRLILNGLILCNICNLIFLGVVSYLFYTRGQHVYYATSGESSPLQLTPLFSPNYSSKPLLPDDVSVDLGPDINLLK